MKNIDSSEDLVTIYSTMIKSRKYEEKLRDIYLSDKKPLFSIAAGKIPGEMHLSAGQEPSAAWMSVLLRDDDFVYGTHRPHHTAISKGVDLNRMTAEIMGKHGGLSKGKGGHMHIFDTKVNFACAGIVGSSFPPALGAALASKLDGKDSIAVAYGGDGSLNQGMFLESLNLASLWKLPVIFVIENNDWAISVETKDSTPLENDAIRAKGFGLPGVHIKDNDPVKMYEAAEKAVKRARSGEGPTLISIDTYRYYGHFEGDPEVYRPKNQVKELLAKDPIKIMGAELIEKGIITKDEDDRINNSAMEEINQAFAFAENSPLPIGDDAMDDVYAPVNYSINPTTKGRKIPMYIAISEAISQEMEGNANVLYMGEDVGKYGGIFGATTGLLAKFGPERIRDTPISESAFIGSAAGLAAAGKRPIVELMFSDFVGVTLDPIMNHIAKNHYMSGGSVNMPVVITTAVGGGYGDAAQHSQTLYALFGHIPGLKVVVPSNSYDAKGLMISAIKDNNPVVYMFHKGLLGLPWMPYPQSTVTEVPEEEYTIPIGKANIVKKGTDVTIVGIGSTVHMALEAAEKLEEGKISAEVIDLRSIKPLDTDTVINSVSKTGSLIVADEDYQAFGLTSEIISTVSQKLFGKMKTAPARVSSPDIPVPYSQRMEKYSLPDSKKIIDAVKEMLKR
ncbi:dehydrogenase E1 component subunit alpha/beta [Ferroplasma sp.]|uniref:alpha-ketoacid dehydrogenase subunit alpha/beta n=1 Tax=Ferroplasma sp. TaxID=2591003 RepID=UPI002603D63E|nr:dehydrogenase E1 component subunit alpha/beta [Ferroplasma sp.]